MEQSRQRESQIERNKKFIVQSNRNWFRETVVVILSLIVWLYSFTVIYFFVDAVFGLNGSIPKRLRIMFRMSTNDIVFFSGMIVILFIFIFILLYGWSVYNKKRYGNLHRRVYPSPASKEDMLNLNMIDEDIYEILQSSKSVVFEKNPINRKTKPEKTQSGKTKPKDKELKSEKVKV